MLANNMLWSYRGVNLLVCPAVQGLHSAMHLQLLLANAAAARSLLVQHNLRLVISIAKRYSNRGVEMADLVQDVRAPGFCAACSSVGVPCRPGLVWAKDRRGSVPGC